MPQNETQTLSAVTALQSDAQAGMLSPQVMMSQLILSEFRNFRDIEWRDFRLQVTTSHLDTGTRLAKAELSIEMAIDGNGRPSRLDVAEADIDELKKFRWQALAYCACACGFLSSLAAFVGWYWPRH
jgi:hypothetical protein